MQRLEGWILDAGVNLDWIELWIKLRNGRTIPALISYTPSFYLFPKNSTISFKNARNLIENHLYVKKIEECRRYAEVTDAEKRKVIRVYVESPRYFKRVIKDFEKLDKFELFNTDIPIAQTFFYDLDLFPMGLCEFEIEGEIPKSYPRSNKLLPHILKIISKDNKENIFYERPPLRIIKVGLGNFGQINKDAYKDRFTRPKLNEPLISCEITLIEGYNLENEKTKIYNWKIDTEYKNESELRLIVEGETEEDTIYEFSEEVNRLDPDIILSNHGDEIFFPYLISRASINGCTRFLYLSRGKIPLKKNLFKISGDSHYFSYGAVLHRSRTQFYFRGRIHIDTRTYGSLHFADGNIHGVIEVARISQVPIQRLTRITIGGALQSIQFHEAYKKGYMVPPEKKNSEDFQTAMTLIQADRGGHIFEPKIGVFERVGEFDFTSMYPMIMTNYNISPDTVNCKCCKNEGNKVPGLPFHTCKKRRGIVSDALLLPLNKRRAYKKIAKNLPNDKAKIFNNMTAALKWILVVSFGYLGFKNARFGRVEGHQTVCAYARDIILNSRDIAEGMDFRVLHGIVDSVWLQDNNYPAGIVPDYERDGSPKLEGVTHFTTQSPNSEELNKTLESFKNKARILAKKMQEKANIPIDLDALYKFIVFLPSREHKEIPVLNHYWAVTYTGEIKVRGIELRRRDAPQIVKRCQRELIDILSKASGICEFMQFLPRAKQKLNEFCNYIDSGNATAEDLVIVNRVSRKAEQYKVKSYQAIASEKLLQKGIEIGPGQKVEYIIKNAFSKDPYKRVMLRSEFEQYNRNYDKEKYKELLKRGFRNIIPFEYNTITDFQVDINSMKDVNNNDLISFVNSRKKIVGLDRFL